MPAARSARYVDADPLVLPDLRTLIPSWTRQAACAPHEALFAGEGSPFKPETETVLASPAELARRIVCAGCPVRVAYLRESLSPPPIPAYVQWFDSGTPMSTRVVEPVEQRSWGVWGGAGDRDRHLVEHLSVDEAVAELERTFPQRLKVRFDAWRRSLPGRDRFRPADQLIADALGIPLPHRVEPCGRCRYRVAGRHGLCGRCLALDVAPSCVPSVSRERPRSVEIDANGCAAFPQVERGVTRKPQVRGTWDSDW